MKRDIDLFTFIDHEHNRQKRGIELIASENFVNPQVMEAMGSCLTNKYAEGYLGPRIMHAILPMDHKGSSDWAYSWIPVFGPFAGALVAAGLFLLHQLLFA